MPASSSSGFSGNSLERNTAEDKGKGFDTEFLEQISTQHHVLNKLTEQNRKDTWDSQFDFLLFLFTFSNGTPQIQMAVHICSEITGGIFFLILIVLNIVFVYPVLVLELFFGSFTKFTFSQIWRMAPLFHGFGITYVFLYVGFLLITALNTSHAVIYTYEASFLKSPFPWSQCHNETIQRDIGEVNIECLKPNDGHKLENCVRFKSPSLSFNCSNHDKNMQFIALHYFWNHFCDPYVQRTQFFRDSFLSHMAVWTITCFFLYKGRNFIAKLVLGSSIFMMLNLVFLVYFFISSSGSTTYSVLRNVFVIQRDKVEWKAIKRMFWFVMYKTPVGFPNIYMTSSAYYNLSNFNPTKYATVLLVFSDLYLMGFIILLHFIDHKLKDIYKLPTNNMFLIEERGILFATIPEYLSNTKMKTTLTILYFWLLTLNILSNHVNTVHVCLLNVFDWIPRYKEFKIQVIFPFCLTMFILSIPLHSKNIVYCLQHYFMFLLTTYGSGISYLFEVWIYIAFYGIPRITNDLLYALGYFPSLYLRITWLIIPVLSLFCLTIMTAFETKVVNICKNSEIVVESYFGILLSILFFGALIKFIKAFMDNNVISLIKPTFLWGPPVKDDRMERKIKGNRLIHIEGVSNLIKLQGSSGSSKFSNKSKSTGDLIFSLRMDEGNLENPYERDFLDGIIYSDD